ncbi:hypothetical protein ACLOJK_015851 [Asimina triloba]
MGKGCKGFVYEVELWKHGAGCKRYLNWGEMMRPFLTAVQPLFLPSSTSMASAAAAAAALGSLSSFHTSSSILSKSASLFPCRNLRTRLPCLAIRAASSSPPSPPPPPAEFNITFGVAPKGVAPKPTDSPAASLFIPWIVRDENGNLKLQSTPPAHLLQAMAHAKTTSAKKKKKEEKAAAVSTSAEPKHSKAARRFYNENFREPQRLSKVLAAAGGEHDAARLLFVEMLYWFLFISSIFAPSSSFGDGKTSLKNEIYCNIISN